MSKVNFRIMKRDKEGIAGDTRREEEKTASLQKKTSGGRAVGERIVNERARNRYVGCGRSEFER